MTETENKTGAAPERKPPKLRKVQKIGQSKGITLPKDFAGLIGDYVTVILSKDKKKAYVLLIATADQILHNLPDIKESKH